jgi:hemolysin III
MVLPETRRRSIERSSSLGEELANSITHGFGLMASAAAAPVLIVTAAHAHDPWRVIAASVFATTLLLLYAASTLYHALPGHVLRRPKEVFRRLDHAAIYLLIAGTYTPFVLVSMRGAWGWSLFGVVWGLAAAGVTLKSVFGAGRLAVLSTAVYVGMGWLVVVAIRPLLAHVAPGAVLWLFAGGLAYTTGVIFFALDRHRYMHAIWHLFVLGGSACHAWAVLAYVLGDDVDGSTESLRAESRARRHLRSLGSKGTHRVHAHGPPRRNVCGDEHYHRQHGRRSDIRWRIDWSDSIEQRAHRAREQQRNAETKNHPQTE